MSSQKKMTEESRDKRAGQCMAEGGGDGSQQCLMLEMPGRMRLCIS